MYLKGLCDDILLSINLFFINPCKLYVIFLVKYRFFSPFGPCKKVSDVRVPSFVSLSIDTHLEIYF